MTRDPIRLVRALPEPAFEFTFDGAPVPALPGQSIAAALWASGRLSWRRTRQQGAPRGAFCGMGVCFDCLVVADGRPNVRACLAPARPGGEVATQEGVGHAEQAH
ncbi:(2Fe-2S)-binding protein [Streptacidiphilus albus]|uniref:(2Fe-2S)-binding protein n=1 Tax=Streptacidiphilus albus TaxID=105425 RepID=UPI00054BCA9C|nr:(2Fe-2S)-binding protein [Streptacidiphilus albus]